MCNSTINKDPIAPQVCRCKQKLTQSHAASVRNDNCFFATKNACFRFIFFVLVSFSVIFQFYFNCADSSSDAIGLGHMLLIIPLAER